MDAIYLIITTLLLSLGIIGIVIPVFPGIPVMFVVALFYGIITKFSTLSTNELIILGIIALVSILVDYASGLLGARYGGASRRSILFGFIGFILGTIFIPPFGGFIGIFLAVLFSELYLHQDHKRAIKAASGSLIGSLAGIILNLLLGIVFIVLFVIFGLH